MVALLDAITTTFRPDLGQALLGAAFGFGIFFLAYLGGYAYIAIMGRMRGEKITEVAFGYGDVMLIALSGLILGLGPLLLTMFITVFLGAAGAIIYLAVRRLRGKHTQPAHAASLRPVHHHRHGNYAAVLATNALGASVTARSPNSVGASRLAPTLAAGTFDDAAAKADLTLIHDCTLSGRDVAQRPIKQHPHPAAFQRFDRS